MTTLSIYKSDINTDLQPNLIDCIYHNNSFQFLFLNNVNIGDNGETILSENAFIVPLNTLSLESNQIGSFGGISLGGMLQRNTTLSTLFLGRNNIGELQDNIALGVQVLGTCLRVNTSLDAIYLTDNSIDRQGVKYLWFSLSFNTTLTTMNLGQIFNRYILQDNNDVVGINTLTLGELLEGIRTYLHQNERNVGICPNILQQSLLMEENIYPTYWSY